MTVKNTCMFIGRLGGDPDYKYLANGNPMAKVGLAVSEPRKGADGNWIDKTTWVDIVAWGQTADRLKSFSKGDMVAVSASYEKTKSTDGKYYHNFNLNSISKLSSGGGAPQGENDTTDDGFEEPF